MEHLKYLSGLILLVIFISCGGDSDDSEPIVPVESPSAVLLTSPENNEECLTGTSVNETQSRVKFQWQVSENTTSYTVYLKNLETSVEIKMQSSTTSLNITINKNTPYKWAVISNATGTTKTAKSEEWKFYNAGDTIINYVPFPADLVAPIMGESLNTTSVSLEWLGSDLDNDIKEYDVYFGTLNTPTELIKTVTSQKVENVEVSSGNTYYWKVVTKDYYGNSSNSEIFQFKVY